MPSTKSEEPKFTKALGLSGESTAKKQPQATESRQSSLLNFDDDDAFDPRGTAAKSAAPEKSAPSASFDAFGDAFGSSGAPSASADFGGFSGFGAAAQPQQPAADLFSSAAPANGSGADLLGGASNTGSSSFPSLMDDMVGANNMCKKIFCLDLIDGCTGASACDFEWQRQRKQQYSSA